MRILRGEEKRKEGRGGKERGERQVRKTRQNEKKKHTHTTKQKYI
jgi:hypothetical protein